VTIYTLRLVYFHPLGIVIERWPMPNRSEKFAKTAVVEMGCLIRQMCRPLTSFKAMVPFDTHGNTEQDLMVVNEASFCLPIESRLAGRLNRCKVSHFPTTSLPSRTTSYGIAVMRIGTPPIDINACGLFHAQHGHDRALVRPPTLSKTHHPTSSAAAPPSPHHFSSDCS
jgi:hypothetical protein